MAEAPPGEGVVIVALPRSGTTLLQRFLDAHPDVACPPETNLFRAAARFLGSERIAEGLDVGVLSGLAFAGFDETEILRRTREMCFGFLRDYAALKGKRTWAEKTPFHVFHLPAIERLCGGHVRWICLLRHPLDVVVSLQDLLARSHRFPDELHAYVREEPNLLAAYAHAWVDGTRAMLDLAGRRPTEAVVVRYEDLVSQPEAEVRRLMETLGLSASEGLIERALEDRSTVGFGDWKVLERQTVDASSVGRWKGLSRHTISELGSIVNETAVMAGYEPLRRVKDKTPEGARRDLELSHMVLAMKARGGQGADAEIPTTAGPAASGRRDEPTR